MNFYYKILFVICTSRNYKQASDKKKIIKIFVNLIKLRNITTIKDEVLKIMKLLVTVKVECKYEFMG